MTPDFIEVMRCAIVEIDSLRQQVENNRSFLKEVTIRLACHQIMAGPIEVTCTGSYWNKILALMERGRICVTNEASVLLDGDQITMEDLESAVIEFQPDLIERGTHDRRKDNQVVDG